MELPKPQGTGNGYPSFRWNEVGATIAGTITSTPNIATTPAIDNPAVKVESLVFELHTNDAITCKTNRGEVIESKDWSVWIKLQGQLYGALYDEVVGAGLKLVEGGRIAIRFAETKDVGKPSLQKIFAVTYKAPAATPSASDLDELI